MPIGTSTSLKSVFFAFTLPLVSVAQITPHDSLEIYTSELVKGDFYYHERIFPLEILISDFYALRVVADSVEETTAFTVLGDSISHIISFTRIYDSRNRLRKIYSKADWMYFSLYVEFYSTGTIKTFGRYVPLGLIDWNTLGGNQTVLDEETTIASYNDSIGRCGTWYFFDRRRRLIMKESYD